MKKFNWKDAFLPPVLGAGLAVVLGIIVYGFSILVMGH